VKVYIKYGADCNSFSSIKDGDKEISFSSIKDGGKEICTMSLESNEDILSCGHEQFYVQDSVSRDAQPCVCVMLHCEITYRDS